MSKWKTYQEVATYLLNQFADVFGLDRVEGEQRVEGDRTQWRIDGKGVRIEDEGFIIVECRRYTTSKQDQEKMAGLAFRILDTGAAGGILVSPLGLQEGAAAIAKAENIVDVRLDADSTPHEFMMQFLNRVMVGLRDTIGLTDRVTAQVRRANGTVEGENGK